MAEQIDLRPWMTGGCLIGVLTYLFACWRQRTWLDVRSSVMAVLSGAGIIAGGHLMICVYWTDQLVHLVDKTTKVAVHHVNVQPALGEIHTIDLLAGGFAVIVFSVGELISLWRIPNH